MDTAITINRKIGKATDFTIKPGSYFTNREGDKGMKDDQVGYIQRTEEEIIVKWDRNKSNEVVKMTKIFFAFAHRDTKAVTMTGNSRKACQHFLNE